MRLVPEARLELALCFQNRILNPACLPIPPLRQRSRSVGSFGCNNKHREEIICFAAELIFKFLPNAHQFQLLSPEAILLRAILQAR